MQVQKLWRLRQPGAASLLLTRVMLTLLIVSPWVQAMEVSPATARSALVDVLAGKGKVPPAGGSLELSDYIGIHTTVIDSVSDRELRLIIPIDADGQIIPNTQWRDAHPEYCKMQARKTAVPSQQLLFTIYKGQESVDAEKVRGMGEITGQLVRIQYTVEARLVSLEGEGRNSTSLPSISESTWMGVQKSDYALGNPDEEMLTEALGDALDNLGAKVGQPTNGCGDIRLEHLFGDQVGQPVTFLAGYQGYYGNTLNYRWDFGDGSSNSADSKQVSHVYTKDGTYAVTVHVSGTHMEPGSQTISVTIKDGLVLHFSSQVSATGVETPDRTFNMSATVPLVREDNTTFTGSATLRNVGTTVHELGQVGCAAGSTYDGRLEVHVSWPDLDAPESPQVSLTIPEDDGRPGVNVSCATSPLPAMARSRISQRIGDTWWLVFREMHAGKRQPDGSFLFEGLEAGQEEAVVATQVSSQSQQIPETGTIKDTTTIELRWETGP